MTDLLREVTGTPGQSFAVGDRVTGRKWSHVAARVVAIHHNGFLKLEREDGKPDNQLGYVDPRWLMPLAEPDPTMEPHTDCACEAGVTDPHHEERA